MSTDEIHWPDDHTPENSRVHASNEIVIDDATPEEIWAWLIRAERWSEWYANCQNLRFENPEDGPDLEMGARFRWKTFGLPVETRVEEFEPPNRLAWSGRAFGSSGYHAWLIEPRESGCRVRTDETQRGLIPTLAGWYLRPQLLKWHQRWLEGLAERAAEGYP